MADRLFVHASAATPAAWEYVLGPAQALRSLRATDCRLTFCGHVHAPALYDLCDGKLAGSTPAAGVATTLSPERRWLAVIGAVGQPRDGNPQACYALLDEERGVLTYVRVPYAIETAARKILDAGLPPFLAKRLRRGV
jgi:diadenosine tetraphosphatase ApaH/serine/threonine PP2A family protein phosphatase